mgnify:CR=1 FL=1|tara:strand:+ start:634 stop:804 length:171 start_codon:yes stop_codon:yes gene_type:complete
MIKLFKRRLGQNEELLKNIKEYEQKKKIEQQESKIHGQKPVKRENSKEKRASLYHS